MHPETLEEFFYISDRKVESYAAQMPQGFKGVSAELSATLGLLSAKLATKEYARNRVARMLLVRKFIEEHHHLGTTELNGDIGTFVKDSLTVRHIHLSDAPDPFLLLGRNSAHEICALFGASQHVVGNNIGEKLGCGLSFFPHFAETIAKQVERLDNHDVELDNETAAFFRTNALNSGDVPDEICRILAWLLKDAKGPSFNVNFLARLVFAQSCDWGLGSLKAFKIFTPLFVSL